MRKLKIYLESSAISHLDAPDVPDKMADTKLFWQDLQDEKYEIYISPVVVGEIEKTREPKRTFLLDQIKSLDIRLLAASDEAKALGNEYLGCLPQKARTIACISPTPSCTIAMLSFPGISNTWSISEPSTVCVLSMRSTVTVRSPFVPPL